MSKPQPNIIANLYPTLLDKFQAVINPDYERFFYQDDAGAWHINYNESEGTYNLTPEEVDARLEQELLDTINRVEHEPSEAASKGTIFNEIVDCINLGKPTDNKDWCIASANNAHDLLQKVWGVDDEIVPEELKPYTQAVARIAGKPFIYAAIDGFEFYFDKQLCKDIAHYFEGSLAQYRTEADITTKYGNVHLYGYIDELQQDIVRDLKTTKSYEFGKYRDYWQRHVYPYCLTESGDCHDIKAFEFTVVQFKGGTKTNPLITGTMYREVYDYNHKQSTEAIRQMCERFVEWLDAHRDKITDRKIFNKQ